MPDEKDLARVDGETLREGSRTAASGREDHLRFRKRPVVIHALQWTGANVDAILDFISTKGEARRLGNTIAIDTLEGTMRAEPGDWIIRGIKGEFYPCKPDVFAATYDRAQTPEPGYLSVDVYFGSVQHDHIEGPMGLHPRGVAEILMAVHEALLKHEAQRVRLIQHHDR